MSKVAIVTDSTAYIPSSYFVGLPLESIPLQVIWGEKVYRDGIDIKPVEFYERLKTATVMPSTSQATPMEFREIYARLLDDGYDILSIHISSKLSGTMDSAIQAKNMFKTDRIELVDSETAGMALGFQALNAAKAAKQGESLSDCKKIAELSRQHTGVYFLVSTLEFLHRGGRIGGASAFLGTMLNLKPILEVRDGRIEAVDKVRTISKAQDRLLDIFEARLEKERAPFHIAALHANAQVEAEALLEKAKKRFSNSDIVETVCTDVSPVIGTHTGPGALALAFFAGN